MTQPSFPHPAAIVLGCGELGSAVALALHQDGFAVVLADEADPSWHRRGMAFTNAWYVGNAELESEGACFCASLKSIPSILARRMIAATTWSWPGIAAAIGPDLLVDARGRRRRGSDVLRGRVLLTIGIGPGFVEGADADVALEVAAEVASPPTATVEASRPGRFMTERRIGDIVRAGQIVGGLGNEPVIAPADGVLLGLAPRGARIETGDTLVEVDPDGLPHRCYGISPELRRIAAQVLSEFGTRVGRARGLPHRIEGAAEVQGRQTVMPL